MPPLVVGKARKASSTQQMLRKQSHASGSVRPDGKPNAISLGKKSAHPRISQSTFPEHNSAPDPKGAHKTQTSRPLITSRPYAIVGVAGFHRGAKPSATRFSQLERRLKPAPHKNVGNSRIDQGSRRSKNVNPSSRHLDHGAGAKSRARRARAVTQAPSNIRRDLLLPNQHRNQVNGAIYAKIVFGGTSSNKHYKSVTQSSSDEERSTPMPANNVPEGHALGLAGGGDDAVWKTMIAAFGALSLSTATAAKKRRLPFLRRNIRTGFHRHCQVMGLAVNPISPPISPQSRSLTILYKMPIDVSENEWDDEVTEYAVHKVKLTLDQLVCPLCDILGRHLITREMLEAHLKWDHRDVETSWRKKKNGSWELALELPGDEVLDDEWEEAESLHSSSSHPFVRPSSPVDASRASEIDHGVSQAAAHETTSEEGPIAIFKFKTERSPTLASRTPSLAPDTFRNSLQKAPSARDPLGALGPPPRLSSSLDDDNDSLLGLSCRPCGPRLFDLIAKDPISKYGLTSWSLLERDEELFEIDDVRDEEKAMQALWNRWIFFKRRQYLLDPRKTVIEYLEAFKSIIMETAGWKGVRIWLLLLAKHKYLTGDDVVAVMTHYESLAGIGP